MADERLLAPMRRFWSKDQITEVYRQIYEAYIARVEDVTVIIGKSNEGESASGQVVVNKADYLELMDALEARLLEIEGAESGDGVPTGPEMVQFNANGRFARG